MFTIKRDRTGQILNAKFDHEISELESFKTLGEAVVGLASRRIALEESMPFNPTFLDHEDDFVMCVDNPQFNVVCRFFIEED